MLFTQELFEKVIAAVHCSFDSSTSNQEKQNAFIFLEDVKENHPITSLTVSFELLKRTKNQPVLHHYGLQLIQSIIEHKWTTLKNDERNLVKEQLFSMIRGTYLNQPCVDPVYIRNSLAKCLVELIKRDCFEKVNTTSDELITMIQAITPIQGLSTSPVAHEREPPFDR